MSSRHSKKNRRGDETQLVKLSKSLSYVLRHHAKDEGLDIREDGLPRFKRTTFEDIQFVVDNNDKKRFTLIQEISDDNVSSWWIRANQGHSIEVKNLELEEITDPLQFPEVIHGTYLHNWKNIGLFIVRQCYARAPILDLTNTNSKNL
ncbi:KptA family-domain-containing protein [Gigaspora rosea]|uniref:2'-phosphotransferase n=1 Tax=Gigaspora rosea TaxID=44941 RepID=A0A397V746_9GLOM|nr:KptA family-domain-containing protein [Gigaspora rosea]